MQHGAASHGIHRTLSTVRIVMATFDLITTLEFAARLLGSIQLSRRSQTTLVSLYDLVFRFPLGEERPP